VVEVETEVLVVEVELGEEDEVELVVVEVLVGMVEEVESNAVEEEEEPLLVAVAELELDAFDEDEDEVDVISEVEELLELGVDECFEAESAMEAATADTSTIATMIAATAA
jgi:hypothetical protein